MARSFGSLGDFFPDTDIRCRVRGCNNVWQFSGEEALHNVARGKAARPERMCEACFALFCTLEDKEIPCSRAGCEHTWLWNRFRQLEAAVQGRSDVPSGLCDACRKKMSEIGDEQVPCRIRSCSNTWTRRARDRVLDGEDRVPQRFCDDCFRTLNTLADKEVPCRIRGCSGTWLWNRYQQLEQVRTGKDLERPPKRMCSECFASYREFADRSMPCKITECERTWTYTAYEQLERKRSGEEGEEPSRMCPECYRFYLGTRDRDIPCRNRGCRNTWQYTRSMQLHGWLKGNERVPYRMCEPCQEKLKELSDREIPCMVPGCGESWVYAVADQLRDSCAGRGEPHSRRCRRCEDFLAGHKAETLSCVHCGVDIHWSAYEQLLCSLGTFVKPERCAGCAEQQLALERVPVLPVRPHHHVVRVPHSGRWSQEERIRDWPPHLTYEVVHRAEKADLRVVVIGDELTYSSDSVPASWPGILEEKLAGHFPERSVVVVNAGIPESTTRDAVTRFERDIAPFAPQLVVFSFCLADSALDLHRRTADGFRRNADSEDAARALDEFLGTLGGTSARVLCWIPNPVFPQDRTDPAVPEREMRHWAGAQDAAFRHELTVVRHACASREVPVLDLRARFEVNGARSARKWMSDWCRPNETGARNIATWMAEYIIREQLLAPVSSE